MSANASNLAVLSSIRTEKKIEVVDHPFHEMVAALQTTLHVEELLDLFSIHLQPAVPHDSYRFVCAPHELELRAGKNGRHTCAYNLILEHDVLGELKLQRRKRFSEIELATIEAYLCRLLYPLRNALMYRRALQSAYIDPLTQTRNRGALLNSFSREWELARRHGTPLSVIMVDVDRFKSINDTHGHDAGDAALREVAASLKDRVRASDIVFRYGGEEFVILLSNTDCEGATQLAERIRQTLENKPIAIGSRSTLYVTASLGAATLRGDETPEALLHRADQAMYRAKRSGRNRVEAAE